ncbi:MAG: peptidoglycan DD-metalloendopeptidase family protein [Sedimentitalea sp.]
MSMTSGPVSARLCAAVSALALLSACAEPLDFDLRGKVGGFSTSNAVQQITKERPKPDARGVIAYPNYQVALARRGDTVADVASRVGLPVDEVARYNGVKTDVTLRDGEVVALPRRVAEPAQTGVDIASLAGSAIDAAPDTTPVETSTLAPAEPAVAVANPEPVRHKVERGETAYTLSRLYQVPVRSLAEWNGLGSDFSIREGQFLLIPVTGAVAPNRAAQAAQDATTVAEPGSGSRTPVPPSAASPLPDEQIAAAPPEPPKVSIGEPSRPTTNVDAVMAMPVQGKIIRTYSKGRNEGIDIAAAPGTPVTAAADGSVAAITSSADQVPIVVVRHPDNLLTVYANVNDIKVSKGDKVRKGQTIASLREGDKAYVHFEVRNGFDSVDPTPYLE